jgi:glycosyltransferase involved in cell wall biosynthesis
MVTGAYYPELSGAGLQCRAVVRRLGNVVDFTVLTTTADRSLPVADVQDGVTVQRVFVDPASWWSRATGVGRFTLAFIRVWRRHSIVHLHGFSRKSILLVWLALATRKQIAIKLTSAGHDDPVTMRGRGRFAYWCYTRASVFFAVSPRLRDLYDAAALPPSRLRLIPNGVDLERFRPLATHDREGSRRQLSISKGGSVVLFVGFFSQDKRPHLLFEAWANVARSTAPESTLVLVGATKSSYYEVDDRLAEDIRRRANVLGLADRIRFIESTHEIERVYQSADVFVLPSVREGLPNVLLEAMASGLACIATRIENVTDSVIEDGCNGLLVPANDVPALEKALRRFMDDPELAARLGHEARRTMVAQYGLDQVASQYLAAYREMLGVPECAV